VLETVRTIIADIRSRGDAALLEYTDRFDRLGLTDAAALEITQQEIYAAVKAVPEQDMAALRPCLRAGYPFSREAKAADLAFHRRAGHPAGPEGDAARPGGHLRTGRQGQLSFQRDHERCTGAGGRCAGDHHGLPYPGGEINPAVLAAARLSGVDRIFRIGGAQAVAALACGTATIPKVDKVTGPGNIYVATAKQLIFGQVGIDMIAGPSEILVINDGSGVPAHIAADLLSQAEHDELASSILITTERSFGEAVAAEVEYQLGQLSRESIARASWENSGRSS